MAFPLRMRIKPFSFFLFLTCGSLPSAIIFLLTVESRKQLGPCIKCQFFKFFKIRVVFEILLNSIVSFFAFSSSYIRVRGIIKVEVFSRFDGILNSYMSIVKYFVKNSTHQTFLVILSHCAILRIIKNKFRITNSIDECNGVTAFY